MQKKLLGEANYESVAKDSILFIPKNQSLLVLSGLVSVRCHEKTIAKPETVSVLQQGGVIGAGEIDRNLSSQPNCWYLALTDV